MGDIKNWVIEYEDWDAYNCETEEEAIEEFKKEHGDVTILCVKG